MQPSTSSLLHPRVLSMYPSAALSLSVSLSRRLALNTLPPTLVLLARWCTRPSPALSALVRRLATPACLPPNATALACIGSRFLCRHIALELHHFRAQLDAVHGKTDGEAGQAYFHSGEP